MIRRVLILAALMIAALSNTAAQAHDFGAMLVTLDVRDATVIRGSIRVDPQHLPTEVARGVFSKLASEVAVATDRLREQLAAGARVYHGSLPGAVAVAERASELRVHELVADASAPVGDGLLHFSFEVQPPTGAEAIAWSCSAPLGRYLLRVTHADESDPASQWLNAGEVSDPIAVAASKGAIASPHGVWGTYIALGFTHIIPEGFDHILFILGLFLMSARLKPVLAQATAFTLAHSMTLALAASGVIHPSPRIVEPLIALSIAAVGVENMLVRKYTRRRVGVAFGFGLLHGLGFAGVLSEIGLPQGQFVSALAAFNIGVELGQIAVILGAFLLVGVWFRNRWWYRKGVVLPGSLVIAAVALVWTVQRL